MLNVCIPNVPLDIHMNNLGFCKFLMEFVKIVIYFIKYLAFYYFT